MGDHRRPSPAEREHLAPHGDGSRRRVGIRLRPTLWRVVHGCTQRTTAHVSYVEFDRLAHAWHGAQRVFGPGIVRVHPAAIPSSPRRSISADVARLHQSAPRGSSLFLLVGLVADRIDMGPTLGHLYMDPGSGMVSFGWPGVVGLGDYAELALQVPTDPKIEGGRRSSSRTW